MKKTGATFTRRGFVGSVGVGAAAISSSSKAGSAAAQTGPDDTGSIKPPSAEQVEREHGLIEDYSDDEATRYFVDNPGSDIMVNILRELNVDHVAINAGSSFRGLHESIVHFSQTGGPSIVTCLHEEQAVAIAHGYAKAAGKPMAVACHGTVGIQHAAMAVYNAWCDYVPMVIIAGNHRDADHRGPGVGWAHSAQDPVSVVRDYIKWDDAPASLQHFTESLVRSFRISMTPPMGPTVIVADAELQEDDVGDNPPTVPKLTVPNFPQGEKSAIEDVASLLLNASDPVIVVDRYARSQEGVSLLVDLAELLQAPVIDQLGRMNFPSNHYLNHTFARRDAIAKADVLLALEVNDVWGVLNSKRDLPKTEFYPVARDDLKVVSIGTQSTFFKSNFQNFQRYQESEYSIVGHCQSTLPALLEAINSRISRSQRRQISDKQQAREDTFKSIKARLLDDARYGWSDSPISMPRLCMELWNVIKNQEWSLVSQTYFQSFWPQKLWNFDRYHQFLGGSGAAGIGYGAPAAVGAALAFKEQGILPVNIQSDGDLLYGPTALWTAAHHNLPLLSVMHNNGGYHQEFMHLQRMASRRRRGMTSTALIGNAFDDPSVDYATLAKSLGVWSSGPITDPDDLGPAFEKALEVTLRGEPALVDVICQPR